ncbi:Kinase/ NEK / Serine/threonine protein kinase [Giardia duodenalis assemblage B]|uniref:non-specific serine/threonine protein kinase n=1 Tax=Giardia duodenalis assemblage B TaxID=1394984 RepID=A0A132NV31_GIAIN|nr:Kinase/ NEK / Serine/threonine protein kinase [Giardia intestinalis assemblage B]
MPPLMDKRMNLMLEDFSYMREDIDNNLNNSADRVAGPHGVIYGLLSTKNEVAKEMAVDLLSSDQLTQLLDELDELRKMTHPNLSRIIMVGTNSRLLLIKMPAYAESLHNRMRDCQRSNKTIHLQEVLSVLRQVAAALEYLHSPCDGCSPTPHYNLKPSNIMFDSSGNISSSPMLEFTADIGERLLLALLKKSQYVAPEIDIESDGEAYTFLSDMWSLGVIAYELLTGKLLHRESHDINELSGKCDQRVISLIDSLLSKDPTQRPTAKQFLTVLNDSYPLSLDDNRDSVLASLERELRSLREEVAYLKKESRASAEERAELKKRLEKLEALVKSK